MVTVFGWTVEQIAYAKQRSNQWRGAGIRADLEGIVDIQNWWLEHSWPDPLSVRLEGVTPEYDYEWAWRAVRAAAEVSRSHGGVC